MNMLSLRNHGQNLDGKIHNTSPNLARYVGATRLVARRLALRWAASTRECGAHFLPRLRPN